MKYKPYTSTVKSQLKAERKRRNEKEIREKTKQQTTKLQRES